MKRLYLFSLLCFMAIAAGAQTAATYIFTRTTSPFVDINGLTGTNSTTGISGDDDNQSGIAIGFSFSYCGASYSSISVCSNGFFSLSNATNTSYNNITGNMGNSGVGFLMPFWDDMNGSGATAYYQTTGTTPNRVFTFQWGNQSTRWPSYTFNGTGTMCFQVKLFEANNNIQFCYGNGDFAGKSATIGIASSSSVYQTLVSETSTTTSSSFNISIANGPAANTVMNWAPCLDPPAPTGVSALCIGGSSTMANATSGGTWSVSGGATIVAGTGVVTATTAGTAIVTYTVSGGCKSTKNLTISAKPTVASITPSTTSICTSSPLTFTAGAVAGTGTLTSYNWSGPASFSATTSANSTSFTPTTTSSSGVYSLTVTYPNPGCTSSPAKVTPNITVNDAPSPISGTPIVCKNANTTLSSTPTGGTWSSPDGGFVSVNPATGVVTGLNAGTATVSYTALTTCVREQVVTINPLPVAVITPSTGSTICYGETSTFAASSPTTIFPLLAQDFNGTLPPWTITNGTGNASSYWQLVPAGSFGVAGDGSQMLQSVPLNFVGTTHTELTSPSFSTMGGFGTVTLSFNQNIVSSGTVVAAIEYSADGGPWLTIVDQGALSAGTGTFDPLAPEFEMELPAGAIGHSDVRLRWVYDASLVYWFIDNIHVNGTLPPSTFNWSGALGLSCNACTTPDITPLSTGPNVYSVTVTSSQGCNQVGSVIVSVNPLPAAIGGILSVCEGNTNVLTSSPGGGTWSTSDPGVASINSGTGAISGLVAGTTTVTYTISTGCKITAVATVIPAPSATLGTASVCVGLTTALSNSTSGGSWTSSNAAVASINSFGTVTGLTAGLTNISYTLLSGCTIFREVTVNALPDPLAGIQNVCKGATSVFGSATTGGTWASSNSSVATVDASGNVTAINVGGATITYTLPTGCIGTRAVTVNPLPAAINGVSSVCQGGTAIMTNATSGGTWNVSSGIANINNTSGVVTTGAFTGNVTISYILTATGCSAVKDFTVNETPANINGFMEICKDGNTLLTNTTGGGTWSSSATGVFAIDAPSGIGSGTGAGTATVTYTLPTTCRTTAVVTVNPLPGAITGTTQVCAGLITTLSDGTPSGNWSSSNLSIATVSATGDVTGISAGSADIMYTLGTGCSRSVTVTVNPLPAAINGASEFCVNGVTTLTDADGGGNWSSSNTAVASVAGTGVVSGISAGAVAITYTLPTNCLITKNIVVNSLPANSTGTQSVCEGLTTVFSNTSPGGAWSSADPAIASVDPFGEVHGIMAGSVGILYTNLTTNCSRTRMVTVNPTPTAIAGVLQACPTFTSALTSSPTNGTWASSMSSVAGINASGVVNAITAGTTMITYTLPAGCRTMAEFTTNPLPASIGGTRSACVNGSTILSNTSTGGTWQSGNAAISTIDANTGIVSGISQGTALVTYTLPTTCIRTAVVTVNPLPAPIAGTLNVCQGSFTSLSDATAGGTWTSGTTAIAPVNAAGVVTGATAGNAVISYTLPTGCRAVASVVVNPRPEDITGTTTLCAGETTTLSDVTINGTWESNNSGVADIDPSGFVTTGIAGNAMISYTLNTGCRKTALFVVNPLPANINGSLTICEGVTTLLTNTTSGGTWTSGNSAVVSITPAGVANGASVGSSNIVYTLPTGCARSATMFVNPLPEPITGNREVCAGSTTALESATPGGVWSAATLVALVNNSGLVNAVAAGTTTITYTMGNSCRRTAVITVNPLPSLIGGATAICPGLTGIVTNSRTTGTWTSDNSTVASIGATSGIVTAFASGSANITYTLPTGCARSRSITVHPAVDPIMGTMAVCAGSSSTLTNASAGGIWISGNTAVAPIDVTSGMFTGAAAGSAMITYRMPTGCTAMTSVMVYGLPGTITGPANVCEGSMINLGNTVAGGSWTSSDDAIASIDAAGMVTGVAMGSVTISYELSTGCAKSRTIMVNPVPVVATMTGGGNYCMGGAGVSIGLDTSENGTTYSLINGTSVAAVTSAGAAVDFGAQTMAGTYTAMATSPAGCSSNMAGTAEIVVNPLVVPTVSVASDMGSRVCAGTLTTFTATGANGGTTPGFSWLVNGTAVAATSSYAFTPADGDVVVAKYASSEVCASPATVSSMITMTVVPRLTPSVSIVVGPNDTMCEGSTAVFYATAANGGDAPVYTWIVGGTIVPGVSGPLHAYIPSNGQSVVCKLNSNYECPTVNNVSSNSITMHVDTKFIPAVTIIAKQGTVVEEGQKVDFTTTVVNAGPTPSFQWLVNNVLISGANTADFSYSNFSDGDSVTCIVYGSAPCGLATINSVVMKVVPATGVVITGMAGSDIRLVPNPNSGTFSVTGKLGSNLNGNVKIEVANVLGQIVYSNNVTVNGGNINEQIQLGNDLANGTYILNLSNGGDRKMFHFVVRK